MCAARAELLFCLSKLLHFCRSCCRHRRRCLSFLFVCSTSSFSLSSEWLPAFWPTWRKFHVTLSDFSDKKVQTPGKLTESPVSAFIIARSPYLTIINQFTIKNVLSQKNWAKRFTPFMCTVNIRDRNVRLVNLNNILKFSNLSLITNAPLL